MAALNSRPARINKQPALEISMMGQDVDFAVMTCKVCEQRSSTFLHPGTNHTTCPHCGRSYEFEYTPMNLREE